MNSSNFVDPKKELAFEEVIEDYFLRYGYIKPITPFDKNLAIFPDIALNFIRQTQPKAWAKLEALHGENTGNQIITDLCKWMDTYGSLHTLRHGFKCYGRTLRIAYFKAAHSLNSDLERCYKANQLGITRQLQYSTRHRNELDITLSLNGIPIVTIELKNPLTGQTVEQGKQQYRQDRDPHEIIFEFKRRTLVHFTVDTEEVWMTTRLAGKATHFLPFNQGYNKGAGNPRDPLGRTYRTAYLWENILQPDSLLDLLAQFLHLQIEQKYDDRGRKYQKETMIFPRFHQLETVRKLITATQEEGVGYNYLVEHSAGSGKSNTIAWLTHRLASLHNTENQRIFDSVIVISDRRILDRQLQDTIYQFEHRQGVIQKIDKDSKQLAEALESAVPIIVTTLQKFPFVTRQLLKLAEARNEQGSGRLPTRRCAVIIDEAHSSQSGDTATELKGVLGGETLHQKAREMAQEEGLEHLEQMFLSMAKRSRQDNLSFFAFTATPKHKTLKFFGRQGEPFHRYTMRQAIEEGFIMDVLKNYTTYTAYFKLLKDSGDDPNVQRKQAAKSLANFMRLHPHNIAQKTQIMVEHFNNFTRHKIGGKAKAMVVTGSRLQAVRYKQSFDKYIKDKGYDIRSLVAFSGIVNDDKIPDKTYTEEEMNQGIREKELTEKFAGDDYQVLLVAEKYQTGFDQPLLHTMYVDKRLAGIKAVQTLSRLNRTHPHKEDTFILDFVNKRQEIQEAFQQFYEGAELGEEAEPGQLYQLKSQLDASGIYLSEEVNRFCTIYFKPKQRQNPSDHQGMNAALDPAVDRFRALYDQDVEEAELWRRKLTAFRNLYSFLSQIIPYQDSDLEQVYIFLRHLSTKLFRPSNKGQYDFDSDIKLEYYRLQKISEGSIQLKKGETIPQDGSPAVGTGILRENSVKLSQLIDVLNNRFGTDFNQADQLFFDQIVEAAVNTEALQQAAQVNSVNKFGLLFEKIVESLFVERVDQNENIFARYMNDNAFQNVVSEWLLSEVYKRLSDPHNSR
ncbi:type I restriction endonuclease subunit R [Limnospira platensis]|uniref:type I restriction endonuclease subunit R n=1 Tax=Limnospira platensis TaxID=118562 RepID=UPI0002803D21|nr:DEAD/DEAH box helicase [Arthrospira platensis C1]UWU45970.1 type I restriction enzyme, R subunit [Arthrospira platensis C1]